MQNATPRQLIGRLQSLLKERKHNSETPLQAFVDYLKAEREVLEILLRIPQEQLRSEGDRITEETPQDLVKSEDRLMPRKCPRTGKAGAPADEVAVVTEGEPSPTIPEQITQAPTQC